MILTFSIQVLQELNAIFLIVALPLAPLALILVNWGLRAHAHGFPLVFYLGSIRFRSKILLLLVAINTTVVTLDPLLLLDTHNRELLRCPLLIHGVVVHLGGLKFLQERVEDQMNQETILDSQIKRLQSSSNIGQPQTMVSYTTARVFF
jgi:hypothetical protein